MNQFGLSTKNIQFKLIFQCIILIYRKKDRQQTLIHDTLSIGWQVLRFLVILRTNSSKRPRPENVANNSFLPSVSSSVYPMSEHLLAILTLLAAALNNSGVEVENHVLKFFSSEILLRTTLLLPEIFSWSTSCNNSYRSFVVVPTHYLHDPLREFSELNVTPPFWKLTAFYTTHSWVSTFLFLTAV